jgi:hypothetical protein
MIQTSLKMRNPIEHMHREPVDRSNLIYGVCYISEGDLSKYVKHLYLHAEALTTNFFE